jgi:hypothetical protein
LSTVRDVLARIEYEFTVLGIHPASEVEIRVGAKEVRVGPEIDVDARTDKGSDSSKVLGEWRDVGVVGNSNHIARGGWVVLEWVPREATCLDGLVDERGDALGREVRFVGRHEFFRPLWSRRELSCVPRLAARVLGLIPLLCHHQ